ncbi:MAG: metallophosphoesterase [Gemmataceae bacterium]|nr:metallophosphoesterase [Gemmataceae bacterium]
MLGSFFIAALLFLGACIGHGAWLTVTLNWFYSKPWPRPLLHNLKILHAVLLPVGPIAFWLLGGFDLTANWSMHPSAGWRSLFSAYLLACWIMAFGLFPLMTLLRNLRHAPSALLRDRAETVDIAERLGFKPAGTGKYRPVCHWPGNEVFQVDFSERTLAVPRLPLAWDGLTILHLTDLHLRGCPDRKFFQQVMDLCRDEEPDFVALTGDVVDSKKHHRWVVPVLGRLRWRVAAYAVLGNHDSWFEPKLTRRRLQRVGFRVLENRWEQIDVRGEPLVIVGHEGPWFQPAPDLSNCPPEPFRLCLSHTPDNLPWGRQHGIDLMLAGHVHGGQVRIPLFGSVFCPSRFSRRYDCGTFHEPPTLMHVSRGLSGQQPIRYNCRPEVTRLVLRAIPLVNADAPARVKEQAMPLH